LGVSYRARDASCLITPVFVAYIALRHRPSDPICVFKLKVVSILGHLDHFYFGKTGLIAPDHTKRPETPIADRSCPRLASKQTAEAGEPHVRVAPSFGFDPLMARVRSWCFKGGFTRSTRAEQGRTNDSSTDFYRD
jgi:hypothetical protein